MKENYKGLPEVTKWIISFFIVVLATIFIYLMYTYPIVAKVVAGMFGLLFATFIVRLFVF
jgi:hypothetical protein